MVEKRTLIEVTTSGVNLFRSTIWSNIKIFLVFCVPWLVVDLFWSCETYWGRKVFDHSSESFVLVDSIIRILLVEIFIVVLLAAIDRLKQVFLKVDAREKESLNKGFKLLWPFVGFILVFAFKVFLWSMLFIVPGLIALVFYGASLFCFVIDGKRGGEAFKMSVSLVKANLIWYLDYLLFIIFTVGSVLFCWVRLWDIMLINLIRSNNKFFVHIVHYVELGGGILAFLFFICFYFVVYDELKIRKKMKNDLIGSSES